jgi:hypothetical protein
MAKVHPDIAKALGDFTTYFSSTTEANFFITKLTSQVYT